MLHLGFLNLLLVVGRLFYTITVLIHYFTVLVSYIKIVTCAGALAKISTLQSNDFYSLICSLFSLYCGMPFVRGMRFTKSVCASLL
jgi:hypothetical protein